MKLIIGLGNPEQKYDRTRHNIGFMVIDWLAEQAGIQFKEKSAFKSFIAETTVNGEKVLFAKPATYYNGTGEAARAIMNFYKLENADVLIVHDELALPLGTLRVRTGGSDAGNNGIKSLNQHLGEDTTRLRIGVSHEDHAQREKIDIVLGKFNELEMKKLVDMKPSIISIVHEFINNTHQVTTYKHD